MKTFIIAFAFVLCGLSAFAQNTVILQRGSDVIGQYNDFTQAVVTAAQDGDIIFINNSLNDATITIDKQLSIIGAGFWPNSSPNEGYTQVNNTLVFGDGSNGSFVTGIRFTNDVRIAGSTSISGIVFDRCRFNTLYLAHGASGFSSSNHIVRNSYISKLYGYSSNGTTVINALITNNIIRYVENFLQMNIFANNIFTGFDNNNSGSTFLFTNNCTFQNNIIFNSHSAYNCGTNFISSSNNNVFSYNMFIGFSGSGGTNNIFTNSFNNVNRDSVFVNISYPGTCPNTYFNFSYNHDYHLLPNCVGVGAGSDGTDIGIYGGPTPWKEQAYPINPRITNFFVTPQVPANGIINVNATVEGQSR